MTEEQHPQPILHRVWSSIARRPVAARTDQDRKWVVVNNFVLHFRPVRVPERTLAYTHTFGLGGMSLVLILILIGTGTLMMFAYERGSSAVYTTGAPTS
jgi:hypothetical protein